MVKYKWGWYVILAGAFILVTVRRPKVAVVSAAVPAEATV
jgi:hypothetical protein